MASAVKYSDQKISFTKMASAHSSTAYQIATIEAAPRSRWTEFVDGFRREPGARMYDHGSPMDLISTRRSLFQSGDRSAVSNDDDLAPDDKGMSSRPSYDIAAAATATAGTSLKRELRGRHLQMIAVGGSIGTGLFISSGSALAQGGPASLVLAFGLIGIMIYCTVQALGEMAVRFPVAGSFSAFSTRFLDPAWGFAMGWNYALQWLIVLPLEIVSATIVLKFWDPQVNPDAFVIIFLVVTVGINFFGVRGYGEAEFVFSIIKTIAVIGFIILGTILAVDPDGHQGEYWRDPGAFNNGFKGLCSVFVTAAFAFAGTELVGLAAAETRNPRKTLPTAIKQVFWRISIFYVFALILVGLLVPYNNPRLLSATEQHVTRASPFVIAIENSGIEVLPSIFNVVILFSVLSVANASVYGSSRTLAALADQRQAPSIMGYIDRKGRPLVCIVIASLLGFLAFFAGSGFAEVAFSWMIAISGLSSIFTWGSICLAHIRFRRAWRAQGHSLDELAYRAQAGVLGSWIGLGLNAVVLVAQFWTGFAPIGFEDMSAAERTQNWFNAYLAAPVVAVFYVSYKLWYRTKVVRSRDMDLHTGVRKLDLDALMLEEKEEQLRWPRWKKFYRWLC